MARIRNLNVEFVKSAPDKPVPGVLYVSMEYASVVHLCCCGCGHEVVTPLSPKDWKLIFNGETITLHPSIGNWSFPCRSHYWIRSNRVQWAGDMKDWEIEEGRKRDRWNRSRTESHPVPEPEQPESTRPKRRGFWNKLLGIFD